MRKIPLSEATAEQLREFAELSLGIAVPRTAKRETIESKIRQAGYGEILLAEPSTTAEEAAQALADHQAPPARARGARRLGADSSQGDPTVLLTLHEAEGAGGKRAVPVGVNGSLMLIPRGEAVEVPYRYFQVLKNAVRTHHEQDPNTGEMTSRDVPAYPYTVHRMPAQAEVDAWLAAQARAA